MSSSKSKLADLTPFSNFIRNASVREKKKVYTDVLKKASEAQKEPIERVEARRGCLVDEDKENKTKLG